MRGPMFSPFRIGRSAPLVLALAVASLAGCKEKREDVRDWRASDHDRADEQQPGNPDAQAAQTPQAAPQGMPSLREFGISDVTLAAWKQNCTTCHGIIGRGDGPQGAMMRPPDLTNPELHKRMTDEEIRLAIKQGRGRMPAFAQLPDDTVTGLIQFVRLLNADRPMQPVAPPAGSAPGAPGAPGSSPPAGSAPALAPQAPAAGSPAAPAPAAPAPTSTLPASPQRAPARPPSTP